MTQNYCDVCGRYQHKMVHTHGYRLCYKHYRQFKKYGKFLDNNPRTVHDRNDFRKIDDKTYEYDLYDENCNVVATGLIDAEDIDKVKYIKWHLSAGGYAINSPKNKKPKHMHKVVMGTNEMIDHINHNTLDNRKCNLRIVNKSQNQMNSNYKGVYSYSNGRFIAHIKLHGKMVYLGTYVEENEAYYARWYAEKIIFKEYRYPKPEPIVVSTRKRQIQLYVEKKVQRLDISA